MSLHIPKTGGSTLLDVLVTRFGDRLQRAYQPPKEGLSKTGTDGWPDIPSPACIHGHGVMKRFGQVIKEHPNTIWITFLREPLRTAVSFYYHHKRHVPWDPTAGRQFHDRGLEAFLSSQDPSPDGYNHNSYGHWFESAGKRPVDFDFIGITERFDESMFLMYHALGWGPISYNPANVGNYKHPRLSDDAVKKFKTRNADDYEIFEQALALLEKREQDYGPDFGRDFASFQST